MLAYLDGQKAVRLLTQFLAINLLLQWPDVL
jgi:hypothetical protein